MLLQQLQHTHVVLAATAGAMLLLQRSTQFLEHGRQAPATKHIGVIQRRRPSLQRAQIMMRIEDLLVFAVRARMRGDHLTAQHDGHLLDVGLDRHCLKSRTARHAIAVMVETHCLVFVGAARLHDAGIEGMLRQ
jgi:hypothetical protein